MEQNKVIETAKDALSNLIRIARSAAPEWIPALVKDYPWSDARPNVPDHGYDVIVFLNGHFDFEDASRRNEAWGIDFGYYDHCNHTWVVRGKDVKSVTNWMERPASPTPGVYPPVLNQAPARV